MRVVNDRVLCRDEQLGRWEMSRLLGEEGACETTHCVKPLHECLEQTPAQSRGLKAALYVENGPMNLLAERLSPRRQERVLLESIQHVKSRVTGYLLATRRESHAIN